MAEAGHREREIVVIFGPRAARPGVKAGVGGRLAVGGGGGSSGAGRATVLRDDGQSLGVSVGIDGERARDDGADMAQGGAERVVLIPQLLEPVGHGLVIEAGVGVAGTGLGEVVSEHGPSISRRVATDLCAAACATNTHLKQRFVKKR